jgi:hypothetical protein
MVRVTARADISVVRSAAGQKRSPLSCRRNVPGPKFRGSPPSYLAAESSAIWTLAAATSSSFVCAWPLRPQPPSLASVSNTQVRYGALDMSPTYAAVYTVTLPKAAQVVDPFHAIALANRCLDDVRRRVQNQQTGHRGRKGRSPLSGPTGPFDG